MPLPHAKTSQHYLVRGFMRLLISLLILLSSLSVFACTRATAENMVTTSIIQTLRPSAELRTLKMGTVTLEEKMGEKIWAVHAVFIVEKFGRKVSEQAVVFRFDESCNVIGSSGAVIQKVTL